MKTIVTIIMLCGVLGGYAQNTPPHAASTKTWAFGPQIWSDAIHMPGCNKSSFKETDSEPDCRSDILNGVTFYYYNRAYIKKNQHVMCPEPWYVPRPSVFLEGLTRYAKAKDLYKAWGPGGYATNEKINSAWDGGVYWTTDLGTLGSGSPLSGPSPFCYLSHGLFLCFSRIPHTAGFQLRCVK